MKCKYCGKPANMEIWNLSFPAHISGYACEACARVLGKWIKVIQTISTVVLIALFLTLFLLTL